MTTVAVPNFLVTRADLSDELVYNITKAIYENLPELQAAHAAAKGIKLEKRGERLAGAAASRRAQIFHREERDVAQTAGASCSRRSFHGA